jgi:hypothetical protein
MAPGTLTAAARATADIRRVFTVGSSLSRFAVLATDRRRMLAQDEVLRIANPR